MRLVRRDTFNNRKCTAAVRMLGWSLLLTQCLVVLAATSLTASAAQLLDPLLVPKYVDSLVIPPQMPMTGTAKIRGGKNADYYEIAVRQFQQQVLPSAGFPKTTVWGYGSVQHPGTVEQNGTFNYPSFTIETKVDQPVRIKWINDLKDPATGKFLPHLLPVDQTIHWANPPGGTSGRDDHGTSQSAYRGPVPIVTHVHGAHTTDDSDGFSEAWFLPTATNIPAGYARHGSYYDTFKNQFAARTGVRWEQGTATYDYPNDQRASTIWYHDHTLGMTRLNVYAGPAGFYLLRGGKEDVHGNQLPGPAPQVGDKPGTRYYEIPIAIQDRSFYDDGSLFYPTSRAFFEGLEQNQLQIPFRPDPACGGPSDVAPIHNPEFFGNTMVVNGRTWPVLNVEPRRYRFRFLNGCDSRTLILKMVTDPLARPGIPALPFWQIGSEGGFLPAPVQPDQLLISLAERADVIVDFTGVPVGTNIYLTNEGPDEPFNGMEQEFADPSTTGQVMKFHVIPLASKDKSKPPSRLKLPHAKPLPRATNVRQVSLNEVDSQTVFVTTEDGNIVFDCNSDIPFGPVAALLGTVSFDNQENPMGNPLMWADPITENPALNATEIWEIYNFTVDAHPIHIHEIQFKVLNREVFDPAVGVPGTIIPPMPWETGFKDTVIAYPGEITRVKGTFDIPGLFVWHCHIVSHEDNEMMRPYLVGNTMPQPSP